eukprot:6491466-Amphidinium_carterae.1
MAQVHIAQECVHNETVLSSPALDNFPCNCRELAFHVRAPATLEPEMKLSIETWFTRLSFVDEHVPRRRLSVGFESGPPRVTAVPCKSSLECFLGILIVGQKSGNTQSQHIDFLFLLLCLDVYHSSTKFYKGMARNDTTPPESRTNHAGL